MSIQVLVGEFVEAYKRLRGIRKALGEELLPQRVQRHTAVAATCQLGWRRGTGLTHSPIFRAPRRLRRLLFELSTAQLCRAMTWTVRWAHLADLGWTGGHPEEQLSQLIVGSWREGNSTGVFAARAERREERTAAGVRPSGRGRWAAEGRSSAK